MRRAGLMALMAGCLAGPAWAAKPASGLEIYVDQNLAVFDGALSACHELDPKTAASMKAELARLKPRMHSAMQKAFADVPELQEPPAEADVQVAREMMDLASQTVGEAAREQGPAFCQKMLDSLQKADPVALAQRVREQYGEFQAAIRGQQKP